MRRIGAAGYGEFAGSGGLNVYLMLPVQMPRFFERALQRGGVEQAGNIFRARRAAAEKA